MQAAAEEMYREYVTEQPEQLVVLMGFLARRGRFQEAIDLCDEVWRTGPPEIAAAATVGVLRQGTDNEELCEPVARRLQEAVEKNRTAIPMMLYLADVRDLQGRFADAESLYREILKLDERNVVALNNLAWLLAQRRETAAEALPLINRAIEFTGPAPEMLDTRAAVLLALGEKEKAITDLQDAIAEVSKPTWNFHLARVFLSMENREAAQRSIETARSIGFEAKQLHPLERAAYEQLQLALEEH
jgi:tetratricopeptide (TPR) repeat protein